MNFCIKIITFGILILNLTIAQDIKESSGILWLGNKIASENIETESISNYERNYIEMKQPFLSGLFSLLVPGTGQLKNKDYLKAALFIVAEGVLIYYKLHNDKKGDDQTEFFENFANQNWSPAEYAKWSLNKFNLNINDYPDLFDDKGNIKNWKTLNKMESDISSTAAGKYYSHSLAPLGEQQYYEMIGKYVQFNPGWKDFNPEMDFNFGDPVTQMFTKYAGYRGEANDYYNTASTFMTLIIVNHFLSAVESFFSAKIHNRRIELNSVYDEVKLYNKRIRYTGLNVKFNF